MVYIIEFFLVFAKIIKCQIILQFTLNVIPLKKSDAVKKKRRVHSHDVRNNILTFKILPFASHR